MRKSERNLFVFDILCAWRSRRFGRFSRCRICCILGAVGKAQKVDFIDADLDAVAAFALLIRIGAALEPSLHVDRAPLLAMDREEVCRALPGDARKEVGLLEVRVVFVFLTRLTGEAAVDRQCEADEFIAVGSRLEFGIGRRRP